MKRLLILSFFFAASALFGDTILTLDTTPLETSVAGPFTLDFQFIDGNGTGDANNTVTLTNFDFGGGAVTTVGGFPIGGVTVGSGPLSVTMVDSSFLNEVQFSLTPGSQVQFDLAATTNPDSSTPDTFTFAILDGNGNEIGTTNSNGNQSFVEVDLPTGTSGENIILSGSAPGADVTLNAPTQGTGGSPPSVPEPATGLWTGFALAMILLARRVTSSASAAARFRVRAR